MMTKKHFAVLGSFAVTLTALLVFTGGKGGASGEQRTSAVTSGNPGLVPSDPSPGFSDRGRGEREAIGRQVPRDGGQRKRRLDRVGGKLRRRPQSGNLSPFSKWYSVLGDRLMDQNFRAFDTSSVNVAWMRFLLMKA